jgi:hypothetical protein
MDAMMNGESGTPPTWDFYHAPGVALDMIDRGNCEETDGPIVHGGSGPNLLNCSAARSDEQAYGGNYSFKYIKGAGAWGDGSRYYPTNAYSTTDMNGLTAGVEYTFSVWVYNPSVEGFAAEAIQLAIWDWQDDTAFRDTVVASASVFDQWQLMTVKRRIRYSATATILSLSGVYGDPGSCFYFDDMALNYVPAGVKIVPMITGSVEDQQEASIAAVLQKGAVPQLPAAGVDHLGFLSGKVLFGDLDSQVRKSLSDAGHSDYLPSYDIVNGSLTVTVKKGE